MLSERFLALEFLRLFDDEARNLASHGARACRNVGFCPNYESMGIRLDARCISKRAQNAAQIEGTRRSEMYFSTRLHSDGESNPPAFRFLFEF